MNDPDVQADALEVAKEKPVEAVKKEPRFLTHEVWRLEWKGSGDDRELVRVNIKKEVKILKEHADILNEQCENTLLEYVKKGG